MCSATSTSGARSTRSGRDPTQAAGAVPLRLLGRLEEVRPPDLAWSSRTAADPTTARLSSGSSYACKAPDGSYWALQRWQRRLPMRGFEPFLPEQAAFELHISHWTRRAPAARGLAELDLRRSVAGAVRPLHLPRRPGLRLRHAVHDASATATRASSTSTRSTRCSAPAGSTRPGKVAHSRNGAFCYSFVPQKTSARLPDAGRAPSGHR